MLKKLSITAGALILLIAILGGIKALQIKAMIDAGASAVPPPEPVTVAVAREQSWAPIISTVGSLTAVQGVTLSAQLDGNVASIDFQPGSSVKSGDLLVQMDISSEQAQLRAAEATVELARLNLERSRELLASQTISQSQFDSDSAAFKQATAQADNIRATIAKKTIRAPFTGRLGVRLINLGQTLKAGDAIVSLQALDPIYADFYLPQQELVRIDSGLKVRVTGDAVGEGKILEGRITAINPDVDSATRNVRVEATLANPDERLRPGMFVDVGVVLPSGQKVIAIPASSVLYAPYGDSVFVVVDGKGSGKVVRQQLVRLGETRGDFVAIVSGIKAGDTVVTTGAFKLRQGMAVSVNSALSPDAQIAPKPNDS
jgi:membrane fusion protein (multidrug efflux system)